MRMDHTMLEIEKGRMSRQKSRIYWSLATTKKREPEEKVPRTKSRRESQRSREPQKEKEKKKVMVAIDASRWRELRG